MRSEERWYFNNTERIKSNVPERSKKLRLEARSGVNFTRAVSVPF